MDECDHRGELIVRLPVYSPGQRLELSTTIEVTVCDLCGVLFVPPDRIQLLKAEAAENLLREQEWDDKRKRAQAAGMVPLPNVNVPVPPNVKMQPLTAGATATQPLPAWPPWLMDIK